MTEADQPAAPPPKRPRWMPDRDLVLSVAAVFVSACALAVTVMQTRVMVAQQHASVWPRLTTSLVVDLHAPSVMIGVRNAGIGPAQVVWAQATFDGAPVRDWQSLIRSATAAAGRPAGESPRSFEYVSLSGSVLVAGERQAAFQLSGPPARNVWAAASRIGLRACYCSVFDRCWRFENPNIGAQVPRERVTPVSGCPPPATPVL